MSGGAMETLKIPRAAAEYISLQRTQYQNGFSRFMRKIGFGYFYDTYLLKYVEFFRSGQIAQLYSREIGNDYRQIREHLPARAANILDIGCGMAGIDVALFKHYGGQPRFSCSIRPRRILSSMATKSVARSITISRSPENFWK